MKKSMLLVLSIALGLALSPDTQGMRLSKPGSGVDRRTAEAGRSDRSGDKAPEMRLLPGLSFDVPSYTERSVGETQDRVREGTANLGFRKERPLYPSWRYPVSRVYCGSDYPNRAVSPIRTQLPAIFFQKEVDNQG